MVRARVAQFSGFRPEVQGLPAVAVLMVVLYHLSMGRVCGGVCRPTVGNEFVWFDRDHLTPMYSQSASHAFAQRISDALQADATTWIVLPEP